MDHLPYSIKYSRSASVSLSRDPDGPAETTIVSPAHQTSYDDHSVAVAPIPHLSTDAAAIPDDSLSITALVVGLASAAFFLLLAVYVVYKVHCKNRHQVKTTKSKINHQHLEEGGVKKEQPVHSSPTANSNLSDLWVSSHGPWPCKSRTFRQALDSRSMQSIDFNSRPSESTLDAVGSVAHARLTAARFITGD